MEDVATPEGFAANPSLVLDFYNQRRRELLGTKPNAGQPIYLIDPKEVNTYRSDIFHIPTGASEGVGRLTKILE